MIHCIVTGIFKTKFVPSRGTFKGILRQTFIYRQDGKRPDEYQVRMGMSFIINERNKEMGADTFLLDRYIALLYAIGENSVS